MKIIVQSGKGGWRWAFVASNGKQTANNETHPTKANAIRAAKAVVASVLKAWEGKPVIRWEKRVSDAGAILLTFKRAS